MTLFPTILEDGTLRIPEVPEEKRGKERVLDGSYRDIAPDDPEFDKLLEQFKEEGIEVRHAGD